MSYITTVTGKHFYPMKPEEQDIDLVDIAHALSLLCRANGHFRIFYSVAQHSLACAHEAIARGCSPEVILGCLLHDASEAYLSDVTRPVKRNLPQYLEAEERLQSEIWNRFIGRELTKYELEQICEIDDLMLSMEFHQLMPEDLNDDYQGLVADVVCEYKNPEEVKKQFIQAAVLDIEVERLLEEEYWLIDVLPSQMPESKAEEYFGLEQGFLSSERITGLYQKFAEIMLLLAQVFEAAMHTAPEDVWTERPDDAAIQNALVAHAQGGSMILLLPKEHTLVMLNAGDLNMTVFHPTEQILSLLRGAAEEKGLYLWQTPQIQRIKKYEEYFCKANCLLKKEVRSKEEIAELRSLVGELESYYGSAEWKKDFADDEAGLLPKKLKRGVLSEDGIYDLLEEYKEVSP
ncbi:MAG: DUF4298 domain-containing protein [Ruminococcus sp.]|nr:DUF4298 domain-containing protein [Ruminococcus sp.]